MSSHKPGRTNRRRKRFLIRLAEVQDNVCFHCGEAMILPDPEQQYENDARQHELVASYDHMHPKTKGGKGGFNLVIAHRGCNSKKGQRIPTDDEMDRLDALNEKRKHLFTPEHGLISASSFGEVTSSTIVLAEVLNGLEGEHANKERHTACRFVNFFYRDIKALDSVEDDDDWLRIAYMVRDTHLKNLAEGSTITVKNFVANVVHSIVKNRKNQRLG